MTVPGVGAEMIYHSAESAGQQSPGREPWVRSRDDGKPCKGDAVCAALTGLLPLDCISQGSRALGSAIWPFQGRLGRPL
jgi:hypothetical protein